MTPRAMKACGTCGTPSPTTPCTDCAVPRTHEQSASARGYDRQWRKLRARAIRRQPWCAWPEGCTYPITDKNPLTGEHVVPIAVDPTRRLDPTNVIVLCHRHNSQRRRLPEPGGGVMPRSPKGT